MNSASNPAEVEILKQQPQSAMAGMKKSSITFSLPLFGLVALAGVASLSIVPTKRCSDWVWKETVPLGSFLILMA